MQTTEEKKKQTNKLMNVVGKLIFHQSLQKTREEPDAGQRKVRLDEMKRYRRNS